MKTRAVIMVLASAAAGWLSAGCVGFDLAAPGPVPPPSDLFAAAHRVSNVALADGGISLARGVVVEDDGPAFGPFDPAAQPGDPLRKGAAGITEGPYWEAVSRTRHARKTLVLDALSARSASLFVFAAVSPSPDQPALIVQVNGRDVTVPPPAAATQPDEAGPAAGWFQARVDPAVLKVGQNELVLRTDSDAESWRVLIAPESHFARGSGGGRCPSRSARSADAGKTWSAELGRTAACRGEYAVRLWLDQHVLSGEWVGPVMDLAPAAETAAHIRRRALAVENAAAQVVQATPEGASVRWQYRSGPSRQPGSADWSQWSSTQPDAAGLIGLGSDVARFVQFRAELATEDPAKTPVIRDLRPSGDVRLANSPPGRISVVECCNGRIAPSSIDFQYEPLPAKALAGLDRLGLGAELRNCRTQFGRAVKMLGWLERRGGSVLFVPGASWNADEILATRSNARTRPLAAQVVLLQAMTSRGMIARMVAFASAGGTYELVEFWSDDYSKWVAMDGFAGRYYVDAATGEPLNAVELQQRALGRDRQPVAVMAADGALPAGTPIEPWARGRLLLIPRNNFTNPAGPLPLNPGWFDPGWSGYLRQGGWPGGGRPSPCNGVLARDGDLYWTCNQAAMDVEFAAKPGELTVYLATQTPSFDTFLASVDQGPWKPVPAGFQWVLAPGPNCLKVQVRNKAGALGPISLMRINYLPARLEKQ